MTEPKRKVGRPRKVQEPVEANPDHEPATKGYVKGLLRKTRGHTHEQRANGNCSLIGAIVAWSCVFGAIIFTALTNGAFQTTEWYGLAVVTAIVCTLSFLDTYDIAYTTTEGVYQDESALIQPYNQGCGKYNMAVAMHEWDEARKKRKNCE